MASCQYRSGKFEYNQPIEPTVGLARAHLVLGYPIVWKLYRRAVAESAEICNSISKLIGSFEERIIFNVDVKTAEYKLQKRGFGYSPKECDDYHYYVDRNIFDAIFELVQDEIDGKPSRSLKIGHEIANINGVSCPHASLSLIDDLGVGNDKEIAELKRRIEDLINDPTIVSLVEQHNEQVKKLSRSQLKKSYREAIVDIWTGIHDNGDMLNAPGSCENLTECTARP